MLKQQAFYTYKDSRIALIESLKTTKISCLLFEILIGIHSLNQTVNQSPEKNEDIVYRAFLTWNQSVYSDFLYSTRYEKVDRFSNMTSLLLLLGKCEGLSHKCFQYDVF